MNLKIRLVESFFVYVENKTEFFDKKVSIGDEREKKSGRMSSSGRSSRRTRLVSRKLFNFVFKLTFPLIYLFLANFRHKISKKQ
jgi:hypothetical protein